MISQAFATRYAMVPGPFGELLVASDDGEALSRLWLPPAHPEPGWIKDDALPVLAAADQQAHGVGQDGDRLVLLHMAHQV